MVKFLDNNSGFNAWSANKDAAKPKSRLGGFLLWCAIFLGALFLINRCTAPKETVAPTDAELAVISNEVAAEIPSHEISSDKITADVRGIRMSNIALTDFAASPKKDDASRVTLLDETGDFVQVGLVSTGTTAPDEKTTWTEFTPLNANSDADANTGAKHYNMMWRNSDGVIFSRTISVDGYTITVTDVADNKTKHDISFAPYARFVRGRGAESYVDSGAVANVNSKVNYVDWDKMDKKSSAYSTTNGFVGFADQYWKTVADVKSPDQTMRVRHIADKYIADTIAAPITVAPNTTGMFTTTIFAGPREPRVLDVAETTIPNIAKTMDYGWFWFFSRPMLWALNVLNSFVMNYGVAIILLTILLRLLMWPLTRKSYTSSIAMQKMQPEMQRIQKLYANDKPRMQMEMMNLYRTHKTSPMSGCLPLLIQIPIFFALYKALIISVNMRNAHFLWISDLAAYDPYFILPILMGVTMWLQQYLQSSHQKAASPDDPVAKTNRMMKWMPILFTIMFAWMPAGLVLYWTVSNIFGVFQTYIIKKQLNKK